MKVILTFDVEVNEEGMRDFMEEHGESVSAFHALTAEAISNWQYDNLVLKVEVCEVTEGPILSVSHS